MLKSKFMKLVSSNFILIPISFFLYSCVLCYLVYNKPIISNHQEPLIVNFPTSLDDVKRLFTILTSYKKNHLNYVVILFSLGYIFKQTFAIPGSALLNILAGALFGIWPFGLILCCTLTAFGASNCFIFSKYAGKDFVKEKFPAQISWLQEKLIENEGHLFLFLVSLRLFPMTPNWLINVIAPIVNVPLPTFFLSVLVGLLPYNFLCLKAGETLSELQSLEDILTMKHLLILLSSAIVVFVLSRVAKRRKVKFE